MKKIRIDCSNFLSKMKCDIYDCGNSRNDIEWTRGEILRLTKNPNNPNNPSTTICLRPENTVGQDKPVRNLGYVRT